MDSIDIVGIDVVGRSVREGLETNTSPLDCTTHKLANQNAANVSDAI
jgi:hypothetical protein